MSSKNCLYIVGVWGGGGGGGGMSIDIIARYGLSNSFFTKSFSGLFPFCLPHYDARILVSFLTGFAQAKGH